MTRYAAVCFVSFGAALGIGANAFAAEKAESATRVKAMSAQSTTINAQAARLDRELAAKMTALYQGDQGSKEGIAKLMADNDSIIEMIRANISVLMMAPLKAVKEAYSNAPMSEDHKLRYFSWDTGFGGTMRFYQNVVAFKTAGGALKTEVLNTSFKKPRDEHWDQSYSYKNVRTFRLNNGKTVYVANYMGKYSSQLVSDNVSAFVIDGEKLKPYSLFKTPKKSLDTIGVGLEGMMISDDQTIHYSKDGRTLYIPLVKENGTVTLKHLIYKFDGNQFVFQAKS